MSLLSALLTQDQVVSPKEIDEAIQREVISGGDFETNLLEVGAIGEDTLAAYCGAVHGVRAVAREELRRVSPEALAKLPVALAERHMVLPFRVDQGRLVVAMVTPPTHAARVELEAAAGMPLELRRVTSARLAWGLSRYFALALPPRLQRLVAKLDATAPGPMPDDLASPLTQARAAGRASTVPTIAPAARRPTFDLTLDEDDLEVDDTPAAQRPPSVVPTAFLETVGGDRSSLHTVVPEGSPAPSLANTAVTARPPPPDAVSAIARSTHTPVMPFSASQPATTAATGAPREPILPRAVRSSAPPGAPPSTRPLPEGRRTLGSEHPPPLGQSTVPAPPPAMTVPPAIPTLKGASKPFPAPPATPTFAPSITRHASAPPPSVTLSAAMVSIAPPPPRADDPPPATRGIPIEEALRRLDAAEDRDAVIEVMLDHAHERFAYVALFMAQGERCVGVASRGEGASGEALRETSLSLRRPSILRLAYDSAVVEVASVEEGTSDAEVRAKLQRAEATEVAVVPLRIGARVALLLWADNGASPPSALAVRQLGAFVQRCAETFTGIIAARKRAVDAGRRRVSPSAGDTPSSQRPERAPLPDRNARLDALRKAAGPADEPSRNTEEAIFVRPPTPVESPAARVEAPAPGRVTVDESDELVAAALREGSLTDSALATLLGNGERGLAAVFQHFPGPHVLKRAEAISKLPVISESGMILRAVVAFRHAALPRLLAALDGPDAEARYCALLCLGEVVHPSAIPALLPKLTDGDYPMRMAAIEVLRNYQRFEDFGVVGAALRATLREVRSPSDKRRAAAHALGELRDAEAVEHLVAALTDVDTSLATAAHRALCVIARQDFGTDPAPWLEWWSGAVGRHRIEWLIDALLHPEPTIRHEASEELKRVTGQFFGYYFNLPRRERERAHLRYVEWWNTDGALRFGAKSVRPAGGA